ncbi:MAG: isoprenylcysteine carboxylmethyltransferase family protein [Proteobacteria bacterium]|nr:isoprenylcysteine carboxylmethyltransferase family protein [Pseudomonadota bacterium]
MTFASFLADYGASLGAFALFALLHSVGAQEPFKDALARIAGRFFVDHFWRILYCALSFWALYYAVAALHWARNLENDVWLVAYPDWLWQSITALHLGSIALVYVAFIQSDYLEFLGLKQAGRGIMALMGRRAGTTALSLFGTHRLVTGGVYGLVRHPMMAAGFWFLLTSGPSLNNLIYTGMYTVYMVIGGYYEEKRMIRVFGEEYLRYRRRVGAFFPRLRPRPAG